MIDVHPPHKATHSWTDFFIHIATIVVGLLIAIGLEQTVEWVHHRHQLAEVRTALDQERDLNRRVIEANRGPNARMEADLSEDARLLKHRAAGDRSSLAGKLNYDWRGYALHNAAWQTAKESAVLGLMPDRAREKYAYHYEVIGAFEEALGDLSRARDRAAAIVRDNPDGNFSEEDTRELIEATHQAQGQLADLETMMKFVGDSSQ
jgi:hypothetical protein